MEMAHEGNLRADPLLHFKDLAGKTIMRRRRSPLVIGASIRIGEVQVSDHELEEEEEEGRGGRRSPRVQQA